MLTSGASAGTLFFYGQNLPTLKSFSGKMQFQNTVIMDRFGGKLFDLADLSNKNRGRRVIEKLQWPGVTLARIRARHQDEYLTDMNPNNHGIPRILQNATIATEDASFYSNPGFDPFSIARAAYDNWVKNEVVSGASTITQQLVRRYMLSQSPTLSRKTQEIVLAAELTQKYPKQKILWYYLNSIPYGNLAIGAEAAAETYFHRHAYELDLAQAALLAGLPEAPSIYNPVTNKLGALQRMHYVLYLMCKHGYLGLRSCDVNYDPPIVTQAMREMQKWKFTPPESSKRYPQFVQYAVNQLEQLSLTVPSLKNKIYNGLRVITTLDPRLQDAAQATVTSQIAGLGGFNVSDGALVSIDVDRGCVGCIRAMVGSANINHASEQINMANSPRQPGSSFKPFNYIYAFQHRLSPATTVYDGPLAIPDTGNPADGGWYQPLNYDRTWHGAVTLRVALDNSLNIPAVKVEQYGAEVAGAPGLQAIANQAFKMGVKSFWRDNPSCCGWALTLGGMEHGMRLVEETAAYGAFANQGRTVPPTAIDKVYDRTSGKLLYDSQKDGPGQQYVFDPAYAYEMNNVLSDNSARCTPAVCEFGLDSPLNLGRTAAAKTGTTNGFTDNWTVGYTPDIVTGVWVGNADNTPMVGTTGITGAAPIWHNYMLTAFKVLKLPPKDFVQPAAGVYSGNLCLIPGAAYGEGTMGYDIYAGSTPYCSVGTSSGYIPLQQDNTNNAQQPAANPAPAAPAPVVQQPVAPQGVAPRPVVPAPAAPPVVQAPPPSNPVPQGAQPGPGNAVAPAAPVQRAAPAPTSAPQAIPGIKPSP
ncbi:MAG: hypothetical protein NVSMB22_15390 [Chloroflexota bacterium]